MLKANNQRSEEVQAKFSMVGWIAVAVSLISAGFGAATSFFGPFPVAIVAYAIMIVAFAVYLVEDAKVGD